jgi:hypothetical protein
MDRKKIKIKNIACLHYDPGLQAVSSVARHKPRGVCVCVCDGYQAATATTTYRDWAKQNSFISVPSFEVTHPAFSIDGGRLHYPTENC